jgi:hypothetical protein
MPSRFAPTVAVPVGFEAVLRDLTREVLRDQPEDIEHYAAKYFARKLAAKAVQEMTDAAAETADPTHKTS